MSSLCSSQRLLVTAHSHTHTQQGILLLLGSIIFLTMLRSFCQLHLDLSAQRAPVHQDEHVLLASAWSRPMPRVRRPNVNFSSNFCSNDHNRKTMTRPIETEECRMATRYPYVIGCAHAVHGSLLHRRSRIFGTNECPPADQKGSEFKNAVNSKNCHVGSTSNQN